MRVVFLFLFVLVSCQLKKSNSSPVANIDIEVTANNQYRVNRKEVQQEELKKVILNEKNKIVEVGFKPEDVFIVLRVDKSANVKSLSDLELVLRQLNIRKIRYMKEQDINT